MRHAPLQSRRVDEIMERRESLYSGFGRVLSIAVENTPLSHH